MTGRTRVVRNLNWLVAHELDMVEIYSTAIDRVVSPRIRHRLSEIRYDHQRHIQMIGLHVTRLGGPRLQRPSLLRHGLNAQIILLFKMGGDPAGLRALRFWKRLTVLRYQIALRWGRLPSEVQDVLSRNLEEERRHYNWLSDIETREASSA